MRNWTSKKNADESVISLRYLVLSKFAYQQPLFNSACVFVCEFKLKREPTKGAPKVYRSTELNKEQPRDQPAFRNRRG